MRPPTRSRNTNAGKAVRSDKRSVVVNPCLDAAQLPPELAKNVDGWSTMSEAIRAGILTMVRAAPK
jgi:hypothetical protein